LPDRQQLCWFRSEEFSMKIALLATAALAVTTILLAPADARVRMMGCSDSNLSKAGTMADNMAEGPQKMMMNREVSMVNTAISQGDMHACAVHLNNAMHVGMMKHDTGMGSGM
jgi:hypothetical protein